MRTVWVFPGTSRAGQHIQWSDSVPMRYKCLPSSCGASCTARGFAMRACGWPSMSGSQPFPLWLETYLALCRLRLVALQGEQLRSMLQASRTQAARIKDASSMLIKNLRAGHTFCHVCGFLVCNIVTCFCDASAPTSAVSLSRAGPYLLVHAAHLLLLGAVWHVQSEGHTLQGR